MENKQDLEHLAREVYFNRNFSQNGVSGSEAMRKLVLEKLGGEYSYYAWKEHKDEVFQLISVAIDAVLPTLITNQFDTLADVKNLALGDKNVFEVEDSRMITVGLVSAGNTDIRRQTITGRKFSVETDWYGAAVYTEFQQFVTGNIDWTKLVNKVADAFVNKMGSQIYDSIVTSYSLLTATRKQEGEFDTEKLAQLAQHVGIAAGGKEVAVYGTRAALAKVSKKADLSDAMRDEKNSVGFLGRIDGVPLICLPQAYKPNTNEFAMDDNTLLVLPQGEKIVAIAMEGDVITDEPDNMLRNDMQMSFETLKKYGLSVLKMAVYGMYKMA